MSIFNKNYEDKKGDMSLILSFHEGFLREPNLNSLNLVCRNSTKTSILHSRQHSRYISCYSFYEILWADRLQTDKGMDRHIYSL